MFLRSHPCFCCKIIFLIILFQKELTTKDGLNAMGNTEQKISPPKNNIGNHDGCITEYLFNFERPRNKGVMGPAHAASAVGLYLMGTGLLLFVHHFSKDNISLQFILLNIVAFSGAGILPDLDNSRSTARNSLGVIGAGLSEAFRASSKVIQTVVRTKRDNPNPNPHRGFWHTIVGAVLLGWLTSLATGIDATVKDIRIGDIAGIFITSILFYLGMNAIGKGMIKRIGKIPLLGKLGDFAVLLVATLVVALLYMSLPEGVGFGFLGWAVALGCIIHVFGDAITKSGVPIFFPITGFTKKKFWWQTRFAKFTANDPFINSAVTNISIGLGIIGSLMIFNIMV